MNKILISAFVDVNSSICKIDIRYVKTHEVLLKVLQWTLCSAYLVYLHHLMYLIQTISSLKRHVSHKRDMQNVQRVENCWFRPVFLNPAPEGPPTLHVLFVALSNTPDSTHRLIKRNSRTCNQCQKNETFKMCILWILQEKHWFKL